MSVLRLSAGGVSFRHRSCVAGHGPGIRVVTETFPCYKNIEVCFLGKNLEVFSFSREYFPYSFHDNFLLRYKTLQYLTYSLLNRPTCNLSL
jgi:hypothetical protein